MTMREDQPTPTLIDLALQLPPPPPSDGDSKRTGNAWTATAHIITAVIGSGIPYWSVARLGWIAGPLSMLAFAGIIWVSSFLLCDCYRSPQSSPGSETGLTRHRSYMEAVKFNVHQYPNSTATISI